MVDVKMSQTIINMGYAPPHLLNQHVHMHQLAWTQTNRHIKIELQTGTQTDIQIILSHAT